MNYAAYLLGKLHRDTIPNGLLMILTENVLHVFYTIFILILIMISDDCSDAYDNMALLQVKYFFFIQLCARYLS